jgi:predicted enzyme related to lactoylglutathione lyase
MRLPHISYIEFYSGDLEASRAFYKEVFDWDTEPWGGDDYFVHASPDGAGPDVGFATSEDGQPITVATIAVDDLPGYLGKVLLAGGEIVVPRFVIDGVGYGAYVTDTTGMIIGLHQRDPDARNDG